MQVRAFQPGDEHAQARIYNTATSSLPGFKQATAEEISRRHAAADADPGSRYYAVQGGEVVGYAAFGPNGRVSAPWCLPGAESSREPLLRKVLAVMSQRGIPEAWAAYRADWSPVLEILREHGFLDKRHMINYVAEVAAFPTEPVIAPGLVIEPLGADGICELMKLAPDLYPDEEPTAIERFFRDHPSHDFAKSLFALKDADRGAIRSVGLLIVDDRFADPTKIDPAMPCFRLGAFGSEQERHKRVNGLFSAVFAEPAEADSLLSWLVATRARQAGLTHIAAQAPSDAIGLCDWYDRFFRRQGAFPILSRPLGGRATSG
ncbi:MAG: hypothetical protein ACLQGP_23020 [Isosphaeraceae bacterium]